MAFFQSFQDMPPIHHDGLYYPSNQEDEFWHVDAGFHTTYQIPPSLVWGESLPCVVHNRDSFSGGTQDMSAWGLCARGTRDGPFIPSGLQQYYRQTASDPNLSYDSNPIQPYPYSPGALYYQRQASPIGTIRSNSLGFDDQFCFHQSYATSDQESIDSPGPLSPSQEADSNGFEFPFYRGNSADSRTTDAFCALPEVQRTADDEMRLLHEPDFQEAVFEDEQSYHIPLAIQVDDDHTPLEPCRGQITVIERRSSNASEEDDESDHKPIQTKARRSLSTPSNHQTQSSGRSKVAKRGSPKSSGSQNGKGKQQTLATLTSVMHKPASQSSNTTSRPFSCPLAPYGCYTTFTSKNEWKRHITSRHLCLGFWRCDLCSDSETRPNDFNRKDLFTQHLRRMHHPQKAEINNGISNHTPAANNKATSKKAKPERRNSQSDDSSTDDFEKSLPEIRDRCWVHIRDAPTKAFCGFCEKPFEGTNGFDAWLEHVGKHLGEIAKQRPTNGHDASWATEKWQKDKVFREWLLQKGFLKPGADAGTWNLVENTAVHDINVQEMEMNGRLEQGDEIAD